MSENLDLSIIGEKIFSKPPQKKFSIQIQFQDSNIKDIFESMLMLTTQGMRILFGDARGKVNLLLLTDKDIKKFNQYLHSFGMHLNLEIEKFKPWKKYDKMEYRNIELTSDSKITDFRLPMVQGNKQVYWISFDFFRDYS